MGESMSEGVLPGLRPVRGKGPSTVALTPALRVGCSSCILQRRHRGLREGRACPWTQQRLEAGGEEVCLSAGFVH